MKGFRPILTDLAQIISEDNLRMLQAKGHPLAGQINWGLDRVVSLQARDTTVKQQWDGTCTTFAVIAAMENKLDGRVPLSERSLWNTYGVYNTEEAIKSASIFFVMEEKFWPQFEPHLDPKYKNKGRYKLIQSRDLGNDYLAVLQAIDNGNPCVVGLSTPQDLYEFKPQVETTSKIIKRSGHAICVSGYKVENGRGYFLVKNSWGLECGNNGYQYVAFELFDTKGYVFFWEVVDVFDRGEQTGYRLVGNENFLKTE